MAVGERIRYHRRAVGMTQAQLGKAIDRDAPAICRMESGGRQPTAAQLEAIVAALGLTMARFYGEVGAPERTAV